MLDKPLNTPRDTCPICGSSKLRTFHVFTRMLENDAFQRYQSAEVNLSDDGGAEPVVICNDCHGLFRRDVIDFATVFANYHDRLNDTDTDFIVKRIETEFASLENDPSCKYKTELDFIETHLSKVKSDRALQTLDIGSREGVLPRALKARGYDVHLIEPTKAFVDVLKDKYDIKAVCNLFQKDAFPDASFDFVSALEVLHRVDEPLGFLTAAHDQLRDGGLLMLGLSNVLDIRLNYLTQQHRMIFSQNSARNLLKRAGFEMIDCRATPGTGRMLVMAQKGQAGSGAKDERDALYLLKTNLLRAEYGRIFNNGPRNDFADGIVLRLRMMLGL